MIDSLSQWCQTESCDERCELSCPLTICLDLQSPTSLSRAGGEPAVWHCRENSSLSRWAESKMLKKLIGMYLTALDIMKTPDTGTEPPCVPPSLLGLPVSHSVRFSPTDLVTVLVPGLGRARHPERPGQHHLATSEHAAPALIMALGQMLPFIAKLVLFCLHSSTWSRPWSRNVSFLPASPSIFQGWLP